MFNRQILSSSGRARRQLSSICVKSAAAAVAAMVVGSSGSVQAADQTWNGLAGDGLWATGTNWVGGADPGAVSGSTSGDTATFNGTGSSVTIDATRNIKSIIFDTSSVGAFTFTGGPLTITNAGTITLNAATTATQTFNNDFLGSPNATNTAYSFINNSTTGAAKLNLTGNITGQMTAATETFTFGGSNGGTMSGAISDGSGGGFVAINKTGLGTWNLTGVNTNTGATSITGGKLDLGTTGVLNSGAATPAGMTITQASFAMSGSAGSPRANTVGTLTQGQGANTITLTADPAQPLTQTIAGIARAGGASTTLTATNLGATPGNGVATVQFSAAPTVSASVAATTSYAALDGVGANNTTGAAILRGVLVDNGTTKGFGTYDPAVGIRLLNGSEQAPTYAGGNVNVLLNLVAATPITGATTNSLQLHNTSGSTQTVTNTGSAFLPAFGLLFTGTNAITLTGGTLTYTTAAASDLNIFSANTAGVSIGTNLTQGGAGGRSFTFGGPGNITTTGTVVVAGGGGVNFAGSGTFNFTSNSTTALGLSSAGLAVYGGGTLKFQNQTGNWLGTSSSLSGTRPWRIANGSTIDMNGATLVPAVSSSNMIDYIADFNGSGGVMTNTSGTLSTVTITGASSAGNPVQPTQTFSGNITGNIALVRNLAPIGGNSATNFAQILSGANTYTGGTTITAGYLKLGANNTLPTSLTNGTLAINGSNVNNAYLDMGGFNQTVASLSGTVGVGSGFIQNDVTTGATSTLTVGSATANTTYAGVIRDNSGGANTGLVALAKSGAGTLTLTGTTNTYTGGTTVSGGILNANSTGSAGTGAVTINGGSFLANAAGVTTGAVTINNTGILGGAGGVGAVTVNSGGNLNPGAVAAVGTLTAGGNLTFSTGSVLNLDMTAGSNDTVSVTNSGALSAASGSLVNLFISGTNSPFTTAGTYTIFNVPSGSIPTQPTLQSNLIINNAQGGVTYTWGISGTDVTLTLASTAFTSAWANANGSTWNSGPNWTSNPTVPGSAGDQVTFGAALTTSGQVTLDGSRTVGTITFNNSGASYDIATGSGGTLSINNNASAGGITNSAGNHTISANVNLVSNTNVTVSGASDTLTFSGNVSGANLTVVGGTGTAVLTGTNSYGTTTVNANNNLQIGNGGTSGTLGSGAATINGNLILNRSDSSTISNAISGSGLVSQVGGGTTTLTGSNSGTWATSVSSGKLEVGNGGASGTIGSGPVSITGGTLAVNRSGSITIPGAITGTGALTQNGGGTLTLSNSNAGFSGPVSVTNSTLNLAANTASGTGVITMNGGTLTQTGNTTQSSGILTNGTVAINPASGTLTLSGNLSSTASTDVINVSTGSKLALGVAASNNNAYQGTVNVSAGAVDFNNRDSGSVAAAWNFTTTGTVTLAAMTGTINFGALSGSSNIFSQSAATSGQSGARVRVGDRNDSTTYSGNATGGLGLAKYGTGSLTLSGQNGFRIDANTLGGGYTPGLPVMIANGTVIAGSSTNGAVSGPLGDNTRTVLLGSPSGLNGLNATLATGGAFTVDNAIMVSAGNNTTSVDTGYSHTLAGNTDNTSTFMGAITLQAPNLTVAQVATTGSNKLQLTGNISGTSALTGPAGPSTSLNNNGAQSVTFAGPGAMLASGSISDGTGVVSVGSSGGTATLSGALSYTGTTSSTGGKLITVNAVQNGAAMNISGGGAIEIPANGAASGVTSVSDLTIAGANSHIELHDNDLVINYSTNPTTYTTVVNQVKSGLTLLGGAGTDGITSVEVDAQTIGGTILAVVDDGDPNIAGGITSLSGYTVPNPLTSVLVKYTWFGDANLDGTVDGSDYALTDTGFTSGGSLSGWVFGDYDYSGTVDGGDYALQDTGFIAQTGALPEPTTLGLLGLGAVGMLRRRRKA